MSPANLPNICVRVCDDKGKFQRSMDMCERLPNGMIQTKCSLPCNAAVFGGGSSRIKFLGDKADGLEVLRDASTLLREVGRVFYPGVASSLYITNDRLSRHFCSSWWASVLSLSTVRVASVVLIVVVLTTTTSHHVTRAVRSSCSTVG